MSEILQATNVDYTILDINKKYNQLRKIEPNDIYPNPELEAARFIVTGYNARENQRARLDTYQYGLTETSRIPESRRDYDSLLGFTDYLPIRSAFEVYPLPNKREQLERKLDILVKFVLATDDSPAESVWLDPGCVPHATLGKFGPYHMVRVFFPGLYHQRSQNSDFSTMMTEEELAILYDTGVRPAIEQLLPRSVHDWPASYRAEVFRSRGQGLGFKNSTKTITARMAYRFGEELRKNMSEVSWGRHMVFQTQIRGVKLGYEHECDPESADEALRLLLSSVDTKSGLWWIDVGLEYLEVNHALIWRSESAHHLVAAALEMPLREAIALTQSTKMRADRCSHFTALAGFRLRIKTPQLGGKYKASMMQAYTTDKQVTYNPEKGHFGKFITPKMAMNGLPPKFCSSLLAAYRDARKNVDVAARIEVRIPLEHALKVLMNMPDSCLRITLISMKRAIWWGYRINRLHGCIELLIAMNQMERRIKFEDATLQTYAGICWLINGLHSRPQDDRTGRTVAKWCLPLTSDLLTGEHLSLSSGTLTAEDSIEGVPATPGGMVWLRHITIPPESDRIAFIGDRYMDPVVFERYFGATKEDFLPKKSGPKSKRKAKVPTPAPIDNSMSVAPEDMQVEDQQDATLENGPFHDHPNEVTNTMSTLVNDDHDFGGPELIDDPPPPSTPNFSSQFILHNNRQPETPPPPRTEWELAEATYAESHLSDAMLDILFKGYLVDILVLLGSGHRQKLTNPCAMDMDDRRKITILDYQTSDLGHIFSSLQWQKSTEETWNRTFDAVFPDGSCSMPQKTVHYDRLPYRLRWLRLTASLSNDQVLELREGMRERFDALAWVPAVGNDRLWVYPRSKAFKALPGGVSSAARILWSHRRSDVPSLRVPLTRLLPLRQEEEEGDSDVEEYRRAHQFEEDDLPPLDLVTEHHDRPEDSEPPTTDVDRPPLQDKPTVANASEPPQPDEPQPPTNAAVVGESPHLTFVAPTRLPPSVRSYQQAILRRDFDLYFPEETKDPIVARELLRKAITLDVDEHSYIDLLERLEYHWEDLEIDLRTPEDLDLLPSSNREMQQAQLTLEAVPELDVDFLLDSAYLTDIYLDSEYESEGAAFEINDAGYSSFDEDDRSSLPPENDMTFTDLETELAEGGSTGYESSEGGM